MRDFVNQTGLQRKYNREQVLYTPNLPNISETGNDIDFTSGDYQYIADLGDIKSYYQKNDPGKIFVTQRPVIYNRFAAQHLTDDIHKID